MSLTRAIAWNTLAQFAGKIVSTFLGVLIVGLMTRHLGQEGFGLYSTANAYFQIFVLILDFGLNVTLVQMLGEQRDHPELERRLVRAVYTLRLIASAILLTGAAFAGLLLPYPWELKLALFAIWGSFFVTALNQIVIGVQQRHLQMHVVAVGEVVGRLVLLGGIILARSAVWGLVPIVAFVSLGSAANFVINICTARRYADFNWSIDVEMWKRVLTRSWPIGLSIFFNLIYYKADTLILSYFRPFAEVGLYGAAYRVLDILTTLPFMYMGIVLPILSHAWASKHKERFASLMQGSYVVMALCAAPVMAGTIALSEQIMTVVAGREFISAAPILSLLVVAAGVIFLGTVSSHAVVALDLQRRMLIVYIITAVLTLLGYIFLIPRYGMWAAAGLTIFSETVVAVASTVASLRTAGLRLKLLPLAKVFAAAGAMYVVILPLLRFPIFVPITAGAAVYAGLILVSGVISNQALKDILSIRRSGTVQPPT